MNKRKKVLLNILLVVIFLVVVGLVNVPDVMADSLGSKIFENLDEAGTGAGMQGMADMPVQQMLGNIIKLALGIVGIVFFLLIIIAGFRWMTSGGNEEAITKSKKTLQSAAIGLLIIFLSYAITFFVFDVVLSAGSSVPPPTP